MEKVKFLPIGLLCVYVLKLIVLGTSFPEMGVVFALTAYVGMKDYMDKHKKVQEMSEIIIKQNEVISKMVVEVDAIKTSMVGLKMNQGFKKVV
jgi:Rieske Fe-S protein